MKNSQSVEIEIKTLLGEKHKADELVQKLHKHDQKTTLKKTSKQLNHYFINGDFDKLFKKVTEHLDEESIDRLGQIVTKGKKHSTRTRLANSDVILVIKATIDETGSENGTARLEFEYVFKNVTLDQLDNILLACDFQYQAKWSREREEYTFKEFTVCLDKNAGYGYLAEFERVVQEGEDIEAVKQNIRKELDHLGLQELPQDRLARMFDHYNNNWHQYYGTDKTFTIY